MRSLLTGSLDRYLRDVPASLRVEINAVANSAGRSAARVRKDSACGSYPLLFQLLSGVAREQDAAAHTRVSAGNGKIGVLDLPSVGRSMLSPFSRPPAFARIPFKPGCETRTEGRTV